MIIRSGPERHSFDDRRRLRTQPFNLKTDENGEKGLVVLCCEDTLQDGTKLKYIELWDRVDLADIMSSKQVAELSSVEQSKLFATRAYARVDVQNRIQIPQRIASYIDEEKDVVTVPIVRSNEDGVVRGVAVFKEKDYVKHIDPSIGKAKSRNGKA